MRGIKLADAERHLFPVPYSPGVREFFSGRNGYVTGILSAGVGLVAERIAKELDLDFVISNPIEVSSGEFTGEGELRVNLWKKDSDLSRIAEEHKLDLQKMLYVGDNDNDIPVFGIVGLPIAFNPKTKETAKAARHVIGDFRELNGIVGTR